MNKYKYLKYKKKYLLLQYGGTPVQTAASSVEQLMDAQITIILRGIKGKDITVTVNRATISTIYKFYNYMLLTLYNSSQESINKNIYIKFILANNTPLDSTNYEGSIATQRIPIYLTYVVFNISVYSTARVFVVMINNGNVITFGEPNCGGMIEPDISDLTNITAIKSTLCAFAVVNDDGKGNITLKTWGDNNYGGNSIGVNEILRNRRIKTICATSTAFAVLTEDKDIISWGNNPPNITGEIDRIFRMCKGYKIENIYSTKGAFAIFTECGKVFTCGDENYGHDVNIDVDVDVQIPYDNIKQIYSTKKAFVLVDNNNQITTLAEEITKTVTNRIGIKAIYTTDGGFAAINDQDTVITWGDHDFGGDSSNATRELTNIKEIYSTAGAFAAINDDGIVITWGHPEFGGDSSIVRDELNARNIKKIYSNTGAFAAIIEDGTVITWGHHEYGGNSSNVREDLRNIKEIYSTSEAFAAINDQGTVITWGNPVYGGNFSPRENRLVNIQNIYSNEFRFVAFDIFLNIIISPKFFRTPGVNDIDPPENLLNP